MIKLTDSADVLKFSITALDYKMTAVQDIIIFYLKPQKCEKKRKLVGSKEIISYWNKCRKAVSQSSQCQILKLRYKQL